MSELIWRGWEAYCFALTLIAPASSLPDRRAPDIAGLMIAWDRLCTGYRRHKLEKQFDLFLPHDENEIARWSAFVEHQCFRPILGNPHLTRCLMWATHMLKGSLEQQANGQAGITSFLEGVAAACGDTVPFSPELQINPN
ncbi:hypothetical protein ACWPM1_13510 [Tsuneonella sp. HG249]